MSVFPPPAPAGNETEGAISQPLAGDTGERKAVHLARLTMLFHRATAMAACPRSEKWKQSSEK